MKSSLFGFFGKTLPNSHEAMIDDMCVKDVWGFMFPVNLVSWGFGTRTQTIGFQQIAWSWSNTFLLPLLLQTQWSIISCDQAVSDSDRCALTLVPIDNDDSDKMPSFQNKESESLYMNKWGQFDEICKYFCQ